MHASARVHAYVFRGTHNLMHITMNLKHLTGNAVENCYLAISISKTLIEILHHEMLHLKSNIHHK